MCPLKFHRPIRVIFGKVAAQKNFKQVTIPLQELLLGLTRGMKQVHPLNILA
jgi:hypothetical protein